MYPPLPAHIIPYVFCSLFVENVLPSAFLSIKLLDVSIQLASGMQARGCADDFGRIKVGARGPSMSPPLHVR